MTRAVLYGLVTIYVFHSVLSPQSSALLLCRRGAWQERRAVSLQFEVFHDEPVAPLRVARAVGGGDLRGKLLHAAVDAHQPQRDEAALGLHEERVRGLALRAP